MGYSFTGDGVCNAMVRSQCTFRDEASNDPSSIHASRHFSSGSDSKKKNAQTMKGNQESVDTLSRSVYNDSAGRSGRLLLKGNCV